MNIKDAKTQIKNAMVAYFTKDEYGDYLLPVSKQRPVFLMGPPGIGKTAIMEQIASEMGVGLLSYSMTHHTRQSALGLPVIEHRNYKGTEYDISEYTMSEIIASVYDMMEETGVSEGILFLDEINCVSETLAPVMLQFLQYKVFGRHRVPDGWIVVTAGNPPEYNSSVRDFDIVTWDRLKRIDVEPDFEPWKEYAYERGIHPAVITFLENKGAYFYSVESTVEGKSFVTARGWEDLSQMIKLYEMNGIEVDLQLISQYLQNSRIARDFASYYILFSKYKSDYQVNRILDGKVPQEIRDRAAAAKFQERLSLIGLLLDAVSEEVRTAVQSRQIMKDLTSALLDFKGRTAKSGIDPANEMNVIIDRRQKQLEAGRKSSSLSPEDQYRLKRIIGILEHMHTLIEGEESGKKAFEIVRKDYDGQVSALKKATAEAGKKLSNMILFIESIYPDGQEMLVVITNLTINPHTARFINEYGCKEYFRHNKDLLIYDRQQEIAKELEMLKLE